jgi:hypothetical protein
MQQPLRFETFDVTNTSTTSNEASILENALYLTPFPWPKIKLFIAACIVLL